MLPYLVPTTHKLLREPLFRLTALITDTYGSRYSEPAAVLRNPKRSRRLAFNNTERVNIPKNEHDGYSLSVICPGKRSCLILRTRHACTLFFDTARTRCRSRQLPLTNTRGECRGNYIVSAAAARQAMRAQAVR